jgi:hypothetical protein
MLVEDFDPAKALAAARCPRCRAVGLTPVDSQTYERTPAEDVHQGAPVVTPSVTARCPACRLVMEWPGCCWSGDDAC